MSETHGGGSEGLDSEGFTSAGFASDGFTSDEAAARFYERNPPVRWAAEELARAQQDLLEVSAAAVGPSRLLFPEVAERARAEAVAAATARAVTARRHAAAAAAAVPERCD